MNDKPLTKREAKKAAWLVIASEANMTLGDAAAMNDGVSAEDATALQLAFEEIAQSICNRIQMGTIAGSITTCVLAVKQLRDQKATSSKGV